MALILPGNAVAAHVLAGDKFCAGTIYNGVGSGANNGGVILTPSTAQQAIAAGFHDGTGHVNGDANLLAPNIISGKTIFGVAGSASSIKVASGTFNFTTFNTNRGRATISGLGFTPTRTIIWNTNPDVSHPTFSFDSQASTTTFCEGTGNTTPISSYLPVSGGVTVDFDVAGFNTFTGTSYICLG